ncbi:MAG: permease [Erysipelotrichaceae bacterium]
MKIKNILKRYQFFIVILIFNLVLGFLYPKIGVSSFEITSSNLMEMLLIIPPIFILLGLLDVWVDKEVMMKYLGQGSGLKGVLISFSLGALAAGPLYAAFPIATVMLKKGAKLFNVFIFIGAWSTAKIPLLTFEMVNLGVQFTLTRLCLSIVGIIIIAWISEKAAVKE